MVDDSAGTDSPTELSDEGHPPLRTKAAMSAKQRGKQAVVGVGWGGSGGGGGGNRRGEADLEAGGTTTDGEDEDEEVRLRGSMSMAFGADYAATRRSGRGLEA